MNYNFVKCLNPKRIRNKYTGEVIIAECGQCEACRLKQSYTRTMRCNLESLGNKYCYFVTLTYSKEYVPMVRLKCLGHYTGLDFSVIRSWSNQLNHDGTITRYDSGEILGNITFPHILSGVQLQKKMKFINDDDLFYSLDYRDVQLFLKRLRKRINERIRVFTCGEYGCIHFRPHYHLLLWFNRESTQENLFQHITDCWPFGIVDASLATSKCSSYVAKYVNGNQYLPAILKVAGTRPFSHHSRFLGEKVLQPTSEEYAENDFRRFAKRRFQCDGFNSDIILWRSAKDRVFPKCSGFNIKSQHERVMSYRLAETARSWTGKTKAISIARFIADYVDRYDAESPFPIVNDMLQYFMTKYLIGHPALEEPFNKEKFCRMVYCELLKSARFLRVQCKGNHSYKNILAQSKIVDDFYKTLDYDNLVGQLKYLDKTDPKLRHFYYTDLCNLGELKDSTIFKQYKLERKTMFSNLMKHRELNDRNLIFNY